jgi:predicted TIM-barrel fold metal-dependent hydrolase
MGRVIPEMTLFFAAIIGVGMVAAVAYHAESDGMRKTRAVQRIATELRTKAFDGSCSPDGRQDRQERKNCFEKNGYRVVRTGMETAIYKVLADQTPEAIYKMEWYVSLSAKAATMEKAAQALTSAPVAGGGE